MAKNSPKKSRFSNAHIGISIFLLCTVAVYAIFFSPSRITPAEIEQNIVEIYEECAKTSGSTFNYPCVREKLYPLVTRVSLETIMEVMEKVLQSNESLVKHGLYTCHPSGHVIGEIAMQKRIPFSDIVKQCGRLCDYGCAHGAFITQMKTSPFSRESINTFCEEYEGTQVLRDMTSCSHIVGHGLGEIYASDIEKSFPYCDGMRDNFSRHSCGQGVIMEHFVGLPDKPKLTPLTEESILSFCESLPGVYKDECYDTAGTYTAQIDSYTLGAKTICDKVPELSRQKCMYSLGSVTFFFYRSDSSRMLTFCKQFQGELELSCLKGAIETSVGETDAFTFGASICDKLQSNERDTCFSFFGDQMEWAKGAPYREQKCQTLSPVDAKACARIHDDVLR